MESTKLDEITTQQIAAQAISAEEARQRIEAYLQAWRMGDAQWTRDCAAEILLAAKRRTPTGDGGLLREAIEEADLFVANWFKQFAPAELEGSPAGEGARVQQRAAMLFGASAGANCELADRTQWLAAMRQGSLNLAAALRPARPPETRAFTMQTSLSRLPSIQLIAGWIVMMVLLFLAFTLTHHRI